METENTQSLARAVEVIQTTAQQAVDTRLQAIAVDDGHGGTLSLPVAFLLGTEGEVEPHSLLSELKEATRYATELRLAKADGPDHRQGAAQCQALDSFIDHANRFKSESSAVWANAESRQLVSVLDYHPEGAKSPAAWGRHRGVYSCPLSEAWLAWGGGKALVLDQDGFADHLDSRDRELTSGMLPDKKQGPDPAALVSLAANLEVFSHATAKRERDPNTGRVKVTFSEEKGLVGSVALPQSFLLFIPVFQDAAPQVVEVRLKVTVDGGHAKFSVQIHAAGDVLREAFSGLCARVGTETSLPVFIGTPEAV